MFENETVLDFLVRVMVSDIDIGAEMEALLLREKREMEGTGVTEDDN